MQIEGARDRIFGSDDRAKRNSDGKREGKESIGLANTPVCQRCSEVPKVGKLLSPIHPGLCIDSETIT